MIKEISMHVGLFELWNTKAEAIDKKKFGKVQGYYPSYSAQADKLEREAKDGRVFLMIYSKLCSDPDLVRKFLNKGDKLGSMVFGYKMEMQSATDPMNVMDYDGYSYTGYRFVLLGACAMSLGCKLSGTFLQELRAKFREVGLAREALKQMDSALNGPNKYTNGVPYDFAGSTGHCEVDRNDVAEDDKLIFSTPRSTINFINVPCPGMSDQFPGAFTSQQEMTISETVYRTKMVKAQKKANAAFNPEEAAAAEGRILTGKALQAGRKVILQEIGSSGGGEKPVPEALEKLMFENVMTAAMESMTMHASGTSEDMFIAQVCGGCGAKDGKDGKPLLVCSKCKTRKYCSVMCQKMHWVCQATSALVHNNLNAD